MVTQMLDSPKTVAPEPICGVRWGGIGELARSAGIDRNQLGKLARFR